MLGDKYPNKEENGQINDVRKEEQIEARSIQPVLV